MSSSPPYKCTLLVLETMVFFNLFNFDIKSNPLVHLYSAVLSGPPRVLFANKESLPLSVIIGMGFSLFVTIFILFCLRSYLWNINIVLSALNFPICTVHTHNYSFLHCLPSPSSSLGFVQCCAVEYCLQARSTLVEVL